jgi:hypothetical protein
VCTGEQRHVEPPFALGTIDLGIRNGDARRGFANVGTSLLRIHCGRCDS